MRRLAALRSMWPLGSLIVIAGLLSWWSSRSIFPAYSWNRDEPVYLWQAETLRAGMFSSPDGGFEEFFRPWLSVHDNSRVFSQYTLGWPLVLVVGHFIFGSYVGGLIIGAALAVAGVYALALALLRDRATALIAGAMMAASPIIIVQGGLYLGYLFTLGLGTCFGAALITGVRQSSRPRLVLAAMLLGAVFLTRPFDALVWAVAIGGPVVFAHRKSLRRLAPPLATFAIGAIPIVVLTLAYNQRMTHAALRFPVTMKDPLDTFGFGQRRIMPAFSEVDYNVVAAVKGSLKNGFYLLLFAFGGIVSLPVAVLALWRRRADAMIPTLVALLIAFPVGYFGFWGTNVSSLTSRISGPIYFVPMYAPLCILMAVLVLEVFGRTRVVGIALAVVIAAAGVPFGINRILINHRISASQEPWEIAAKQAQELKHDSLIFMADSGPYLMFYNPYSANTPNLDGRVVWAVDRAGENVRLIDALANRTAYRMQASYRGDELGPDETPKTPVISLIPLEVVRGQELVVSAVINNPANEPAVVVTLWIDGKVVQETIATNSSYGDRHLFSWRLSTGDAASGGSHLNGGVGTFTIGVGFGSSTSDASAPTVRRVLPYRVDTSTIDVVVPLRAERLSDIDGPKLRWRPTVDLDELVVAVTSK